MNEAISPKSPAGRLSRTILLGCLVGILQLFPMVLGASQAEARDPWLWPFAKDSIWNMPIGSAAVYKPANLPRSSAIEVDPERHIKLKASDPIRPIYAPSSWAPRWPGDKNQQLGTMPVPDDLIIPDVTSSYTPNECSSFLMPDGKTVKQLEPTTRAVAASQIVGWPQQDQDITGPGIRGSHYGSGLSTLGGSIRLGELTSSEPLHHALKLNAWGEYLYYSSQVPGYRWPAYKADSYANGSYHGSNPDLVMGSLLAIPPSYTAASLGLTTELGKKFFDALQNYGAYIVDDTTWSSYAWSIERGVDEEVKSKYGTSLVSYSSNALFEDMQKMIKVLNIVTNNTANSIGGGGTPRAALAPDFGTTPTPTPTTINPPQNLRLAK